MSPTAMRPQSARNEVIKTMRGHYGDVIAWASPPTVDVVQDQLAAMKVSRACVDSPRYTLLLQSLARTDARQCRARMIRQGSAALTAEEEIVRFPSVKNLYVVDYVRRTC